MSVPYTDSEASEARQWSNRYGPPNAWTASLGTAARMIGRLLDERERLMAKQTVAAPGDDYIREWCEEFQRWKAVAEEKQDLRDHFAAAALAGLLSQCAAEDREAAETAAAAMRYADAMLRERCRAASDCPSPDNAPNHDAAPVARAPEPEPEPAARRRPAGGTGDTPAPHATPGECSVPLEGTEPVAWGVAGLGGILATSTSRTDAVDIQSEYAFVTEVVPLYRQAPNFAPPPPDNAAKAPDNAEPEAWAVCAPSDGDWSPCFFHEPHAQRFANAIFGSKNVVPLYRHPPVTEPMPKEKRAEVCAGPLAWAAIRENGQPLWLSYDRSGAEGMVNGMAEVVPLYRSPTLTDAEREAVETCIADDEAMTHHSRAATLRGLLERLR